MMPYARKRSLRFDGMPENPGGENVVLEYV